MQCLEHAWPSNEEYMQKFMARTERLNIPISGSLELTHRCNLNCVHCYLGPQAKRRQLRGLEMSTARVLSLLDEMTEAGCLNLLITGGEPLLREDFPEIYRHAKTNGLLVTVFTNGTLVTDKIIGVFREFPPLDVEISLYGATAETYESITGVPGSHGKCLQGIRALLKNGIKADLKTILMTINRHEFSAMENFAGELGVRFRFDAAISPRIDGDRAPLSLRVSPEEAVAKEMRDTEKVNDWKKLFEKFKDYKLEAELYACSAGLTAFHVDPFGFLQPCMMTYDIRYDISEAGFPAAWKRLIPRVRQKKAGADFACRGCNKINLCGYCPDLFRLETGAEAACSEYACRMGDLRFQYINSSGHHA